MRPYLKTAKLMRPSGMKLFPIPDLNSAKGQFTKTSDNPHQFPIVCQVWWQTRRLMGFGIETEDSEWVGWVAQKSTVAELFVVGLASMTACSIACP